MTILPLPVFLFCSGSAGRGGPGARVLIFLLEAVKNVTIGAVTSSAPVHVRCGRGGMLGELQELSSAEPRAVCLETDRPLSLVYHRTSCSTLAALFLQLGAAMMNYRLNTFHPSLNILWLFLSLCAVFFQTSTLEIQFVLQPCGEETNLYSWEKMLLCCSSDADPEQQCWASSISLKHLQFQTGGFSSRHDGRWKVKMCLSLAFSSSERIIINSCIFGTVLNTTRSIQRDS